MFSIGKWQNCIGLNLPKTANGWSALLAITGLPIRFACIMQRIERLAAGCKREFNSWNSYAILAVPISG